MMMITSRIAIAALLILATAASSAQDTGRADNPADWPAYQGGPSSNQYSALDQINRENVHQLEVAWTYNTGDQNFENGREIQCNPIIIDGVLYASSPQLKIFALDAATGEERWVFDPFSEGGSIGGSGVNRGVTYWSDGDDQRILFTATHFLYALDARTGKLDREFGDNGAVDLRVGLGRDPSKLFLVSNTPGAIYKNLIIMGMRTSEGLPSTPGHMRAYDVRTGEIAWTFQTIPQPGEFGYETWPPDAYLHTGGVNAWAGMSVDEERGIVFVPTGSASYDFYGGDRHGENLFANTLLALNAATGERIWHFQTVHHDIWDRDLPAPPNLVTVVHDGKRIDAVAQIAKSSFIFLFDRETGEPLFPIEERPVPPSDLIGEQAWPTQPFPTKPPPFARQGLTEEEVTNRSPEARDFIMEKVKRSRAGAQFIPPSLEGTIIFPGLDGGGEWGGAAVDPETGILYVNSNEMGWLIQMVELSEEDEGGPMGRGKMLYARNCVYCHGVDRKGDSLNIYPSLVDLKKRFWKRGVRKIIRQGKELMPSFPHLEKDQLDALVNYLMGDDDVPLTEADLTDDPTRFPYAHTGYFRFVDQDGYSGAKPPWGTLNAIDLNKGEILWKVTLGDEEALGDAVEHPTGAENYGGPVVTAGGLIFIGATRDEKFRAFDKDTGALLWERDLPAAGHATASSYGVDGRQFVVIAAGGSKLRTKPGDAYVAFALPR